MNNGDFIKWSGEDEEGKFSHIGKVISQNDVWVEFVTNEGTMAVRRTDGTFESHAAIQLTVKAEARKQVEKAVKSTKSGTKLAQAIELYQGMKDASRKDLIAMFVERLGMTPAGASTYAATVRKHS